MMHEMETGNDLSDLIDQAEAEADQLDNWQRANHREMRYQFIHANATPADLVEKWCWPSRNPAMLAVGGQNDFASLAPKLTRCSAQT